MRASTAIRLGLSVTDNGVHQMSVDDEPREMHDKLGTLFPLRYALILRAAGRPD